MRAQLLQLKGEDAQHMVDFLSIVTHEEGILDDGGFVLSRLLDLAEEARVFPRYYQLTGIESDFQPIRGGAFADVCEGQYKSERLCLKMIRLFGEQNKVEVLKIFVKELALWAHLSHPNILPFYGVYLHSKAKRICLVSPWMEKGNLHEYLQHVPETPRLPLITDIIEGLHYLHVRKITHGNLNSINVLISDDGRALIGDFALSYIAVASEMTSRELNRGSTRWMSPELFHDGAQKNLASDMWSFGCLCYEVLTCKIPFHDLSESQVIASLSRSGGGNGPQPLPGVIDTDGKCDKVDQMWKIVEKCWNSEPTKRPTCDIILTAIAGIDIQDTRPKSTTKAQDGQFSLQAMGLQIDYDRVLGILQRIHQI